jgi:hypothetical protein
LLLGPISQHSTLDASASGSNEGEDKDNTVTAIIATAIVTTLNLIIII